MLSRRRLAGTKTVLLSTVPKQAPKAVDRGLLIERVNDDLVVVVRNTPVVVAPLSQVLSPPASG
ncbi:integral membrane indolylacetylinositol arabinosyltransferase EmbC domain protein [Mycobacterium xenopi 4042]|uniref:Integral membrane indolylacetylinositol arabinosyltransferase EmbC domain protein n=1 Tax=Mycobacterium xenopi 4042 TaxID=1299334 RepID=X7ZIE8_MYCXE|nr:integral membrane indolylacetylinositol arabinosyltransferase EmbC domain protein [Mycobacterium xenopi 4042]